MARKREPETVRKEGSSVSSDSSSDYLIQAHLNEYQALTMRNTYWITLQFACWPTILLYLTLGAQLWNLVDHLFLIWTSGAIVQLAIMIWQRAAYEIYNNTVYMETTLRHQIQSLIEDHADFWGYERYLHGRQKKGPLWHEAWPALLCLLGYLYCLLYHRPKLPIKEWTIPNWTGISLNFFMLVAIFIQHAQLIKIRARIIPKT
jgi:hypothetical protein